MLVGEKLLIGVQTMLLNRR